MRTSEVARALYVSPKTVDNWRHAGKFRDHVIELPGPTYRFHAAFIADVVAGRDRLGEPEPGVVLQLAG